MSSCSDSLPARAKTRFYDRFEAESSAFRASIEGIPDEGMRRSYASILLNRLMFVYFLQSKGFLNGDPHYLRSLLDESRRCGRDRFYPAVLSALFFESLSKKPSMPRGGTTEEENGATAGALFPRPPSFYRKEERVRSTRLFEVRVSGPSSAQERDRSPAVTQTLGRVPYLGSGLFARHRIEDLYGESIEIADTAFARLFDFFDSYHWHAEEGPPGGDDEVNLDVLDCVFEKHANRKQLAAYYTNQDVTDYIAGSAVIPRLFDIVQQMCGRAFEGEGSVWRGLLADPERYIFPAARKGVGLPLPPEIAVGLDDASRRAAWNERAPGVYALPAETWREVIARRQRSEDVKARLRVGQILSVSDLIALNLDLRRLAEDAIAQCDDAGLLYAFYRAITQITVLDPTCGSGAFLLAALSVMAPLYEACLGRMQALSDEAGRSPDKGRLGDFGAFREILGHMGGQRSHRYFILKSIVANNLYGVDIDEETVEACKLRLLLTLVAQAERAEDVEPLPDLGGSIRAGNALVGFGAPGQEPEHKPQAPSFRWDGDFHDILGSGGFDVIVGNPPYLEYSKVREEYAVEGYETESCGNLYAFVVEQSLKLCRPDGRYGLILQLSSVSTRSMAPLQSYVRRNSSSLHVSSFAERPQQLFAGACIPLAILLGQKVTEAGCQCAVSTSGIHRWYDSERGYLFQRLSYVAHADAVCSPLSFIPKLGSPLELPIWQKFCAQAPISKHRLPAGGKNNIYYRTAGGRYWKVVLDFPFEHESTANKAASFDARLPALAAVALLSSNLFWWYYTVSFDLYNLKDYVLFDFRFDPESGQSPVLGELVTLGAQLMAEYRENATMKRVFVKSKQSFATYSEYLPRLSKPTIDKIDRVLARQYGFTAEEVDFIINYDVKYRMGRE